MKPKLVRCHLNDLQTLVTLSQKTYLQYYQHLWYDQGRSYIQEEFNHQTLMRQLQQDRSAFYLIELNKKPVGYIKLNYQKGVSQFAPEKCLEVQRIYFLAHQTRKGLGSYVLRQIEKIAGNLGLSVLWLQVLERSAAEPFYLRNGYKPIGNTTFLHPQIKCECQYFQVMVKLIC